jgi:hypothetical protein
MEPAVASRVTLAPGIIVALALLFAFAGLVLFAHPYRGIEHDAVLYALQALRSLEPQSLGDDLFFRYGSQDAYTLFSPLYAALISLVGLEPAAHLIARFSLLALFLGGLLLARRMMQRDLAWLAIALFISIPGNYGADNVLKYAENFATPRTLTEALVITSLGLLLGGQRVAAFAAIGVGFLLHPLMAVPGLIAIVLLLTNRTTSIALFAAGMSAVLIAILVAAVMPIGPIRLIDPIWHASLAELVPYLLLERWSISDWQPTVVGLATLVAATRVLQVGPSKKLATIGAITGLAGIALAGIASIAPVALIVQGQPWRWMWLGKALAVLLLVPVGIACWQRSHLARTALALLVVAWFARNDALGVVASLLAFLALTLDAGDLPTRSRRLATWGFLLLALILGFAALRVHWLPVELMLAGVVIAIWWLLFRARPLALKAAGAAAAIALGVLQLSATARTRGDVGVVPDYGPGTATSFAAWREHIGKHQTVFFPEHPEMVWLVLHRKSYAAYAAPVFSREAALATHDRFRSIQSLTTPAPIQGPSLESKVRSLTQDGALRACQVAEIDFVITPVQLPAPALVSSVQGELAGFRLYACTDLRRLAAN